MTTENNTGTDSKAINRETRNGTAYDVRRFTTAAINLMETNLLTNVEVKVLEELRKKVKETYLER